MSVARPAAAAATPADWLAIATLGVLGGASFMGTKLALAGFAPLALVALRLTLAAGVLWAAVWIMRLPAPAAPAPVWRGAAQMAVLGLVVPFALLAWGQQHVSSAFAGLTMGAVPLLVLPIAAALLPDAAFTRRKLAALALGFAGVVLLVGLPPDRWTAKSYAGAAACLGAALCYALASVMTRRAGPAHPLYFGALALSIAAALTLPAALAAGAWPQTAPPPLAWAALVYLALGPTALATLLLVRVVQRAGPGFLSLTNYQIPVWAVIFGAVLLREDLPPALWPALALILGGLALSRGARV